MYTTASVLFYLRCCLHIHVSVNCDDFNGGKDRCCIMSLCSRESGHRKVSRHEGIASNLVLGVQEGMTGPLLRMKGLFRKIESKDIWGQRGRETLCIESARQLWVTGVAGLWQESGTRWAWLLDLLHGRSPVLGRFLPSALNWHPHERCFGSRVPWPSTNCWYPLSQGRGDAV